MDRFRREGKALFDSMPRVDGGLALAPGYAGGLRAEDTWTVQPFSVDLSAIPSQQERDAAYARAKEAFIELEHDPLNSYRREVPDALEKGKEFDGDHVCQTARTGTTGSEIPGRWRWRSRGKAPKVT